MQAHHPLVKDFPEFRDQIHELKVTSSHFVKLEREYEDIDKEVVRLESGIEHASSADLEQKKLRRVALKDELYAMLKASAA
ncbi:DUF465 domain-containing protein [Aquabacterium sp. A3]|uniref:YdcH family protein n=1 Tax=Aquabacterium sp. A3 TaxID=3132829 RepID=UPI00311A1BA3